LKALVLVSRVCPNNNVATEYDKASNTDCRNNCFGKVSHYSAIVSCESPTSLAAAGTVND